jgi:peptide/nickel transport system ATP-binding protein
MPAALSVRDLCIEARTAAGTVAILHGATLEIAAGEIVGIVGESGSGKTTLVRSVIGLLDRNVRVVSGSIAVHDATII